MISDVVLLRSPSKSAGVIARVNVAAQRLITLDISTPAYTHVALLLGTYKAVHAMRAPEHVGLTLTYELLSPKDEWVVWRHQALAEKLKSDEKSYYKFLWEAELYVGQHYNHPLHRKKKRHHSFCSELVGRMYQDFGYAFSQQPEKLMPINIAKTVQDDRAWREVTDEYRTTLQDDPRYRDLYDNRYPEKARRVKKMFLAAKKEVNATLPVFTEPIEGLTRFERFEVQKHKDGWQVWAPKEELIGSRDLPDEALEWLLLMMHDEVEDSILELLRSPRHNQRLQPTRKPRG